MDQALSLYLLETIPLVNPEQADYALILLTMVESIVENPDIILRKQLDRLKDRKMAEMKMEGVPYEQRIEELEHLEYPKPNREFIYSTFNAFADRHPWDDVDVTARPTGLAGAGPALGPAGVDADRRQHGRGGHDPGLELGLVVEPHRHHVGSEAGRVGRAAHDRWDELRRGRG